MKKLFFLIAIFATAFVQQSFAQSIPIQQEDTTKKQLSELLNSYYDIKNALVNGNANSASAGAEQFVKNANGIDYKVISESNINALVKDAGAISKTKDIKQQRQLFANFSGNMFALAKSVKLTSAPVYQAYCPMKRHIG